MAADEVRIRFIADMEQLKQQMLAGGASVEEAEKKIQKLAKAYRLSEKAAASLSKQQEDAGKRRSRR
jgi:hypothetical protein